MNYADALKDAIGIADMLIALILFAFESYAKIKNIVKK